MKDHEATNLLTEAILFLLSCLISLFKFSLIPWSHLSISKQLPVFPTHCFCICHSSPLPSMLPRRMDRLCFRKLWKTWGQNTCWGEWLNNQLSFLTVPNELDRSHGQKAISPLLPHLWTQLFHPFFLSIPSSQSMHPFTWSRFTGNGSACWCIFTNLQIMSPLPLPFSLNNLSKRSWVTFASECCQSGFPPCLLKRPWEEASAV